MLRECNTISDTVTILYGEWMIQEFYFWAFTEESENTISENIFIPMFITGEGDGKLWWSFHNL